MRANIYIRKDNEARWNDIRDKSAWVNEALATTSRAASYSTKTRQVTNHPPTPTIKTCPDGHPVPSSFDHCVTRNCKYKKGF